MRTFMLAIVIFTGLMLSACTTVKSQQPVNANTTNQKADPSPQSCQKKNPMTVSFYTNKEQPNHPYKILGKETISKYNLGGIKRQEANLRDAVRQRAAALGGDAVIISKHTDKTITATVISYDNSVV